MDICQIRENVAHGGSICVTTQIRTMTGGKEVRTSKQASLVFHIKSGRVFPVSGPIQKIFLSQIHYVTNQYHQRNNTTKSIFKI